MALTGLLAVLVGALAYTVAATMQRSSAAVARAAGVRTAGVPAPAERTGLPGLRGGRRAPGPPPGAGALRRAPEQQPSKAGAAVSVASGPSRAPQGRQGGEPTSAGAQPGSPPKGGTAAFGVSGSGASTETLWRTAERDPDEPLGSGAGGAIAVSNPQGSNVLVRTVGPTERIFRVSAGGRGQVAVSPGKYKIRYVFADSKQVYEGEQFTVEAPSTSGLGTEYFGREVQLVRVPHGNYATYPVSGPL